MYRGEEGDVGRAGTVSQVQLLGAVALSNIHTKKASAILPCPFSSFRSLAPSSAAPPFLRLLTASNRILTVDAAQA